MTLEKQEVTKTFQDKKGSWIPFRFKKLNFHIACEIKTRRGWKEYAQADSEIKALREAKEKWNQELEHSQATVIPLSVGKVVPCKETNE